MQTLWYLNPLYLISTTSTRPITESKYIQKAHNANFMILQSTVPDFHTPKWSWPFCWQIWDEWHSALASSDDARRKSIAPLRLNKVEKSDVSSLIYTFSFSKRSNISYMEVTRSQIAGGNKKLIFWSMISPLTDTKEAKAWICHHVYSCTCAFFFYLHGFEFYSCLRHGIHIAWINDLKSYWYHKVQSYTDHCHIALNQGTLRRVDKKLLSRYFLDSQGTLYGWGTHQIANRLARNKAWELPVWSKMFSEAEVPRPTFRAETESYLGLKGHLIRHFNVSAMMESFAHWFLYSFLSWLNANHLWKKKHGQERRNRHATH